MNNPPSLLITFDAESWQPVAIFPVADNQEHAAWLRMLAERMIEALPKVDARRNG